MHRTTIAALTLGVTLSLAASSALAVGTKGMYRQGTRMPVRALSVGVSSFENMGPDSGLPSAERDAVWFDQALRDQLGVESSTVLTGPSASAPSVMEATKTLLARARPDEAVVLFLATHGALQNNRGYLLTWDSEDTRLGSTSLPLTQLKRWVTESEADQVLIFADTAHGALTGVHGLRAGPEASLAGHLTALGGARDGVLVLSTDGSPPSQALEGCAPNGLFACALVRGLKGAADLNRDSQVTLSELVTSLPDVLAKSSGGQLRGEAGGRFDESLGASADAQPLPSSALPARYETVTHPDVEVCLYQDGRLVPPKTPFANEQRFDLSLTVPEGGHLHLVNVDPAGVANYLFPAPGEDNRVSAGTTTRILPPDTDNPIVLRDPKGAEHVYVVWTREGGADEDEILALASAHASGTRIADAQWAQAVGTKSLVRLADPPPEATSTCATYTPEGVQDAWVLSLTVDHR